MDISFSFFTAPTMFPAQVVNVAEAGLKETPLVTEFLQRLQQAEEVLPGDQIDRELFGDTFAQHLPQPKRLEKNQKGGLKALLNFQKVNEMKKVNIEDLDLYFVAFA